MLDTTTILLIICIVSLLFVQYAIIFMALIDNEYKGERKQLKRDLIPYLVYFYSLKYLFDSLIDGVKFISKKIKETEYDSLVDGVKTISKKIKETEYDGDKGVK